VYSIAIDFTIAIDFITAITPSTLFGIDRDIAYANRKYLAKEANMKNSPNQ
jgi:hypothetical protein